MIVFLIPSILQAIVWVASACEDMRQKISTRRSIALIFPDQTTWRWLIEIHLINVIEGWMSALCFRKHNLIAETGRNKWCLAEVDFFSKFRSKWLNITIFMQAVDVGLLTDVNRVRIPGEQDATDPNGVSWILLSNYRCRHLYLISFFKFHFFHAYLSYGETLPTCPVVDIKPLSHLHFSC